MTTRPSPALPPSQGTLRVLVADDEPLLAAELVQRLRRLWPEIRSIESAADGISAVARAVELQAQVCFLDIRMPGQSGLDAAREIVEDWPDTAGPLPLIVFVTAYDEHAVAAFEASASDYLLKPVTDDRLSRTVNALRRRLAERQSSDPDLEAMQQLLLRMATPREGVAPGLTPQEGIGPVAVEPRLQVIQAAVGSHLHFVPVEDVLLFEAADKYVRVITAEREYLIRTSLRELQPRLDPETFWQVHRGTLVRATAIEQAVRDESGRITLRLRGLDRERPVVSRLHQHRFKAM